MPPKAASSAVPTAEDPLKNVAVQMTLFEHVSTFPPHGPFAYLSALVASERPARPDLVDPDASIVGPELLMTEPIIVPPQRCLDFFHEHWNCDHLRTWPALYVAADARLPASLSDQQNASQPKPV
jgi:hypothetical protein